MSSSTLCRIRELRSTNSHQSLEGQGTPPQNPAAENRDHRGNEESPDVPAEEQPDDGPTRYIYFLKNLEHHDWGSNNDAVIVAENETQARQIPRV